MDGSSSNDRTRAERTATVLAAPSKTRLTCVGSPLLMLPYITVGMHVGVAVGVGVGEGGNVAVGVGFGVCVAVAVAVGGGWVAVGVIGGGSLGVGTAWHQTSVELSGVPSLP